MNFPDHDAVNAQTGFLLKKVSTASFEAFAAIVGAHGLHPMHFGMLMMIDAEEPISQRDLSCRTGIDQSTMVARMDVLVEKGLVDRLRSEEDRRSYEISLSTQGRRCLKKLRMEAQEHGVRFYSPLTEEERALLHALLEKLANGVDDVRP